MGDETCSRYLSGAWFGRIYLHFRVRAVGLPVSYYCCTPLLGMPGKGYRQIHSIINNPFFSFFKTFFQLKLNEALFQFFKLGMKAGVIFAHLA